MLTHAVVDNFTPMDDHARNLVHAISATIAHALTCPLSVHLTDLLHTMPPRHRPLNAMALLQVETCLVHRLYLSCCQTPLLCHTCSLVITPRGGPPNNNPYHHMTLLFNTDCHYTATDLCAFWREPESTVVISMT